MHRGVYSLVAPAARPALAAEHAALLTCGHEAVLSHATAAWLHGLIRTPPGDVHLTRAASHRHSRPGLVLHRSMTLARSDRVRVGRLWVTSIPRTVQDLARTLDDRAFERLVDEALKRRSRASLIAIPRARALLAADRPSSLTASHAEERLLALIRAAGLPAPEVNVTLGDYVPDLLWREQRVIVEFDSYAHHSGPAAFHHDRQRHSNLTALEGYRVIHVTWRVLTQQPERALVWIAVALARADWALQAD
jgi:very-short-patch-repair endonuclease